MGLKGLDTKAKRRHFWRLTKKFHHLKINSLLLDLMMSCSEHPQGIPESRAITKRGLVSDLADKVMGK